VTKATFLKSITKLSSTSYEVVVFFEEDSTEHRILFEKIVLDNINKTVIFEIELSEIAERYGSLMRSITQCLIQFDTCMSE
jgi:hypothetical protein